jgi:hypothetical protein
MTGFLARVVARATGREGSLAPRPDYRFAAVPSMLHDLPSPRATLTSLPPVSADAGDTPFERALQMEMSSLSNDIDAGPQSPAIYTSTPPRNATPPAPQYAAPQAPYHADEDVDSAPGIPNRPDRARDVRNGPFGQRDLGGDADARLMPLGPAGSWDVAQPASELSAGDASRFSPSIDHRPAAVLARARAERIHRDATPTAQEPPTIHVHIGRIDVRAVQPTAPAPPAPPKSRLQRPTLEVYLRNYERGRS